MKIISSKRSLLEKWLNVPAVLEVPSLKEKVEGTIQYRKRVEIREPDSSSLLQYTVNSRGRMEIEKAYYWFVNEHPDPNHPDQSIKIKLLTTRVNNRKEIVYGKGRDITNFKYIIRKK